MFGPGGPGEWKRAASRKVPLGGVWGTRRPFSRRALRSIRPRLAGTGGSKGRSAVSAGDCSGACAAAIVEVSSLIYPSQLVSLSMCRSDGEFCYSLVCNTVRRSVQIESTGTRREQIDQ